MFNNSKKGQGLGGMLKVIVVGIFFLSTFAFFSESFSLASDSHTGAVKWLIAAIPFIIGWFFLNFAFKLGGDGGGSEE